MCCTPASPIAPVAPTGDKPRSGPGQRRTPAGGCRLRTVVTLGSVGCPRVRGTSRARSSPASGEAFGWRTTTDRCGRRGARVGRHDTPGRRARARRPPNPWKWRSARCRRPRTRPRWPSRWSTARGRPRRCRPRDARRRVGPGRLDRFGDRWNDGLVEVDVVAYELYGLTPDEFTAARNARARELTRAGNRPLATEVRALAKPSTAAWLVNILVRRRPETLELLDLGPQLRQAVGGAARDEVRRLSDRRQELIRVLAGAASVFATEAGHALGPQVQRQLEGTLEAGVADEAAAAAIRGGALAGPLSFVGFATVAPGKAGTTKPGRRGRGRATEAASQESVRGGRRPPWKRPSCVALCRAARTAPGRARVRRHRGCRGVPAFRRGVSPPAPSRAERARCRARHRAGGRGPQSGPQEPGSGRTQCAGGGDQCPPATHQEPRLPTVGTPGDPDAAPAPPSRAYAWRHGRHRGHVGGTASGAGRPAR